ncbi:hypothetical protein ABW20_dc0104901 [Dactylellina cionopaga]|nr:hypothetical protein ABW20_dc0104901 [Dactylellina cionopaga]
MPPSDTPPEVWVEDVCHEVSSAQVAEHLLPLASASHPHSTAATPQSVFSDISASTTLPLLNHALDLPFLLQTLHTLEPTPCSFDHRRRKTDYNSLYRHVESDLKILNSLSTILVTGDAPSLAANTAAIAMRVTKEKVQLFFAKSRPCTPQDATYLTKLLETVRKMADGEYDTQKWKGEKEVLKIVLKGCASRINRRLRQLAETPWAEGVHAAEGREGVDWDSMLKFGGGEEEEEEKDSDDDSDGFYGVELHWEKKPADLADSLSSEASDVSMEYIPLNTEPSATSQTRKGMIMFLTAIKSLPARPTWMRLARSLILARIMVRDRDLLKPHIQFTDTQIKRARKAAVYLDVVEMIIRKASSCQTRRMLVNIEVNEITQYENSIPPQLPPPSTTILQILQRIEREQYRTPHFITAEVLSRAYPHLTDKSWTYNPQPQYPPVHPEVALANFIAKNISALNLPFLVIGISKTTCWACDVYIDQVHRRMLLGQDNTFFADDVYLPGCSGYVPGGAEWVVPRDGWNRMNGVDVEFYEKVREAVGKVVVKVRDVILKETVEDMRRRREEITRSAMF